MLRCLLGNDCCTDCTISDCWYHSWKDISYFVCLFFVLMASFGLAKHVIQPLHSLSDVWPCDTKQRSGFTADPADWLIGWIVEWLGVWVGDISRPSLIKLPRVAVFESDTGKLAKDHGHSGSAGLWCGRGRSLLLLGLVSRGQGQGWGGCWALWMSGGSKLPSSHFICLSKRRYQKVQGVSILCKSYFLLNKKMSALLGLLHIVWFTWKCWYPRERYVSFILSA